MVSQICCPRNVELGDQEALISLCCTETDVSCVEKPEPEADKQREDRMRGRMAPERLRKHLWFPVRPETLPRFCGTEPCILPLTSPFSFELI